MNIDELTIGQLKQLQSMLGTTTGADDSHWEVGKCYFVRTVTHYLTGRLTKVTPTELVLVDAAWIADTGRYHEALLNGTFEQVEPYPDGLPVILGRGALVDAAVWKHELPRDTK